MARSFRQKQKYFTASLLIQLVTLSLLPSVANAQDAILEKGIVYSARGGVQLDLDLARPSEAKGKLPALIYLCGNARGFYGPCKGSCTYALRKAALLGYVAISIDYRDYDSKENGKSKWIFPEQLYDAKCAVRWLYANAKKYNIDTKRIAAIGLHRGANLALFLGLTIPADGLEGPTENQKYPSKVKAVVNIYGPVWESSEGMPEQYREANPINFVRKGAPAILTIHLLNVIDIDPPVVLLDAENLNRAMKVAGAPHTFIVKRGHLHHAYTFIFDDDAIWQFLEKHLK